MVVASYFSDFVGSAVARGAPVPLFCRLAFSFVFVLTGVPSLSTNASDTEYNPFHNAFSKRRLHALQEGSLVTLAEFVGKCRIVNPHTKGAVVTEARPTAGTQRGSQDLRPGGLEEGALFFDASTQLLEDRVNNRCEGAHP